MRRLMLVLACLAVACSAPTRSDDDDSSSTGGNTGTPDAGGTTDACGGCPGTSTCVGGQCQGSSPTSCLDPANCVGDSDCASGSRCNNALTPPRCEKLYCGAAGATCEQDYFCASGLRCITGLCRTPPLSGAVVNGMVGGVTLTARDAIAGPMHDFGGYAVLITDYPGSCARLEQHGQPAPSASLGIYFTDGLPRPQAYEVTTNFFGAMATMSAYGAGCTRRLPQNSDFGHAATGGTVTVTAADAETGIIQGTFDLNFDGPHLTGSFTTRACASSLSLSHLSSCEASP